jgi:hypothetical protein
MKMDIIGGNASGGNMKMDIIRKASGGNMKMDIIEGMLCRWKYENGYIMETLQAEI